VAVSLAAVLWGFDGVVLTPRLQGLDIMLVVFLLHAIPFALMQPFLFRSYGVLRQLNSGGMLALLAVSLCGGVLGTYAIVQALFAVQFNQLSVVVLLQKLQPLFAIGLAGLVLRERIRGRFLVRAIVAVIGAYLLAFGFSMPEVGADRATVQGAIWAVVAAAAFGGATVLGKLLLRQLDFRVATFGRYGMTALVTGIYLVLSGGLSLEKISVQQAWILLLIGLTTGSGALFLYYRGLGQIRAITAAICELWLPLSAVVFDRLVNGSVLAPVQWFGGAVLLTAITLVSIDSAAQPSKR